MVPDQIPPPLDKPKVVQTNLNPVTPPANCQDFDGKYCLSCLPGTTLMDNSCVKIPKGCRTYSMLSNGCAACDTELSLTAEGNCKWQCITFYSCAQRYHIQLSLHENSFLFGSEPNPVKLTEQRIDRVHYWSKCFVICLNQFVNERLWWQPFQVTHIYYRKQID